jgi:cytochrome b pre-mRNA-processing protein 3
VLSWFRSRAQDRRTAIDFYGAIVAQARRPAFFADHGVLDTPEGRTAMIILLMFPLLERLQGGDARERRLARLLAETFVTDVDDCLREMGVGDLSVPKKVKRAAQALGERCLAYRRAAAMPEPVAALARELAATVPGLDTHPASAEAVARFTLRSVADLRAVPAEGLAAALTERPELLLSGGAA